MGARLTLAALAAWALPLSAQAVAPLTDTAETYTVTAYGGRMSRADEHVDLAGIEVLQLRPERFGARFQAGTWWEVASEGSVLVETEAGPAGAFRLVRGLTFVPTGGAMVAFGNGIVWGLYANAGLLVEPAGRLVGRISVGRHWYRQSEGFLAAATWTVGAGWRLGPTRTPVAAPP